MKKVDFGKLLEPVTWKLVDVDNYLSNWSNVRIEGQFHLFNLVKGHLHMKIITGFSLKPVGHFELKILHKLLGTRKLKFTDTILIT